MIGDYMTKPLVGEKFRFFRDLIMNTNTGSNQNQDNGVQQECVGYSHSTDDVQTLKDIYHKSEEG